MTSTKAPTAIPAILTGQALRSLRDAGYSFAAAIGEVVDNSIEAKANEIAISMEDELDAKGKAHVRRIAIADDGIGMGRAEGGEDDPPALPAARLLDAIHVAHDDRQVRRRREARGVQLRRADRRVELRRAGGRLAPRRVRHRRGARRGAQRQNGPDRRARRRAGPGRPAAPGAGGHRHDHRLVEDRPSATAGGSPPTRTQRASTSRRSCRASFASSSAAGSNSPSTTPS